MRNANHYIKRLAVSLLLGLVGTVVGGALQLQLNAKLTGNYQHNFLGDHAPMYYLAFLLGGLGLMFPSVTGRKLPSETTHNELAALQGEPGPPGPGCSLPRDA